MTSSSQVDGLGGSQPLVAAFTVVYLIVRVLGDDTGQPAFPTQQVPEPSMSASSGQETQQTDERSFDSRRHRPDRLGDGARGP